MRHLGLSLGAIAILITFLGSIPSASAQRIQWFVDVHEDEFSGKPILNARVITADGFQFRLFKRKDSSIWGEFTLQRGSGEVLSADRLPVYRVDANDPFDLDELKALESGSDPTLWKLIGSSFQFIIWGAAQPGFIPPALRQMMLGETLSFTYFTILGERSRAEIPLRRANQAIAQFLRTRPLNPKTDTGAPDESFTSIANDFRELCEDMRFTGNDTDYTRCRDTFALCSDTPDQTIDSFKTCLGIVPNDPALPAVQRIPEGADSGKPESGG
jgi:hypothetical protein